MGDAFLDAFVRVLIVLGSSGGLRSGNIPDILFNHARCHQLLIDEQVALIALHAASSLLRRVALLAGLLLRALVVLHQTDSLHDGTVVEMFLWMGPSSPVQWTGLPDAGTLIRHRARDHRRALLHIAC